MRDLDEVLAAGLDERERLSLEGAAAGVLAGVNDRVRRARARRHATQGVAVMGVAMVLGAASWWGLGRSALQPAVTPEPTVTSAEPTATTPPTSTASGSESPTAPAAPSLVDVPGLPPMPQATPQLIASTTPGWVLATYRVGGWNEPAPTLANAVLLLSPAGDRLHVADLPLELGLEVDRWVAGSTMADATVTADDGARRWVRVDLVTGEVVESTQPSSPDGITAAEHDLGWSWDGRKVVAYYDDPPVQSYPGDRDYHSDRTPVYLRAFDGTQTLVQTVVWLNGSGRQPLLDPSGTLLLFWSSRVPHYFAPNLALDDWRRIQSSVVVDLRSGAVTTQPVETPETCHPAGWFADGTVFAVCGADYLGATLPSGDPAASYADGWPDVLLGGYRLDALGSTGVTRLFDLPDYVDFADYREQWIGGATAADGVWLERMDGPNGDGTPWPWLFPSSPAEPHRSTVDAADGIAAVVDVVGQTVYVSHEYWDGPLDGLRALAPGGSQTDLFPIGLPHLDGPQGQTARLSFAVGH